MDKIKIVDYFSINTFHEVFNTSLILMCAKIFPEVKYLSGKTASRNNRKLSALYAPNTANVTFKTKHVCEKDSKAGAFIRTIVGFFITIYEYIFSKPRQVIIYNYTNPLSMPVILLLNFVLRKKIIFTMHGELELQYQHIPLTRPAGWYKQCHTLSLKYLLRHNTASVLVLGDSIKDNLIKLFPQISQQIISINHPYFIEKQEYTVHPISVPLKIGTVGVMKKEKGSDYLIALSKRLEKEIKENKVILYSIGRTEGVDITQQLNIQWIGHKKGLSRDDFETHIKNLDFILYLYPTDSYKLTASGAIMDAIKLQKPIISLNNDYFNGLFKENPIGYTFDTLEDIVTCIHQLLLKENFTLNFQSGYNETVKKISIQHNANILKQELIQKHII